MKRPPIYFLRHGETDWNVAGRLQGRRDIPLNATGRSQARRNGGVLAEMIEASDQLTFVASPLSRTRQTMRIVREALRQPDDGYQVDDRLLEIDFGDWEGHNWREIEHADPESYRARTEDGFGHRPPGGESYADVMQRVTSWLADIARPTVVVSHGGVMRCLRGHVLGLAPAAILHLDVPQDKVMLIEGNSVHFL
jgi:probable phosphoglycerate mutase